MSTNPIVTQQRLPPPGRYEPRRRQIASSRIVIEANSTSVRWHLDQDASRVHKQSLGDWWTWCEIANAIYHSPAAQAGHEAVSA